MRPNTESLGTPPAIRDHHRSSCSCENGDRSKAAAKPAPAAATPAPVLTAATTTIASAPIAAPTPAASTSTPLQLRETQSSHPLELAPEPAANSLWKLGAILALMGAGAFALKKHNEKNKPAATIKSLQVLKKLSIGVRTELIVVDVDGQRLLLGVTPSSIQTLASLPDPEPMEMQEPEMASASRISPTVRPAPEIGAGARYGSVNASPRSSKKRASPKLIFRQPIVGSARHRSSATTRDHEEAVGPATEPPEGQARGLAKIGRIGMKPDLTMLSTPGLSPELKILALLTVLSLLPAIVLTMTSFTRVVVVLSFARQGVGAAQAPPNQVLIGIALFVTMFTMAPVVDAVMATAYAPYAAGKIDEQTALERAEKPLRAFMLRQTREADLALFYDAAHMPLPKTEDDAAANCSACVRGE